MGRYGQAILTIVGTVVGAYFGYPALGAALGSLAGSLLFPQQLPTVSGPRLQDLQQTTSNVGAPIPRGWGTFPAAGCVIAKSDVREVIVSEEVGGKGGPSQTVETPTYYQDFAIGLNDGRIGGIRTIWANGKAIYDRRPRRAEETDSEFRARMAASDALDDAMVIYLGTEDQEPDPTLEAFYGVGEISAFRGLAYVVFINWQRKQEDGNRMPAQWKFEVFETANESTVDDSDYTQEVLLDWNDDEIDPRVYGSFPGEYSYLISVTPNGAPAAGEPPPGPYDNDPINAVGAWLERTYTIIGHACHESPGTLNVITIQGGDRASSHQESDAVMLHYSIQLPGRIWEYGTEGLIASVCPGGNNYTGGRWGHSSADIVNITGGVSGSCIDTWTTEYDGCFGGCASDVLYWTDVKIEVTRVPQAPPHPCLGATPIGANYCVTASGRIIIAQDWHRDESQDYHVLQTFSGSSNDTKYPLGPARPVGHAQDIQSFWELYYQRAVLRGDMEAGLVYGVDYPQLQDFAYTAEIDQNTLETDPANVANIVRDLCLEAGLEESDIDVTDLAELTVMGYVRTRVMAARGAIDPLRQACFFDGIESGRKIKFIRRGKAIVATIDEDQMGVFVQGETPPSKITTRKLQDKDLPRSVRVHYLSQARDYEAGEQPSPVRVETTATNDQDVELPVVLEDEQAAQIAQVLWADAWAARWTHEMVLDAEYHRLEPTDAIAVPVDGQVERMRIMDIVDALPAVRKLSMTRDDDGSYVSYALPSVPPYVPPPINLFSPVELIMMDLPPLRDEDDDAGFYGAARALLSDSFKGMGVFRSTDGGGNYVKIAQSGTEATIGTMFNVAPDGPTGIWDEGNELLIELQSGTLESRTEAAVLNGANAAAIGAHGRWEIVQFRNAENVLDNIWRLTGLLRGRRGTEHHVGTGQLDDSFVLISGNGIIRIPLPLQGVGREFLYKAVGTGITVDAADEVAFTGAGEALKPFSPTFINADRDSSTGHWTISWIRRGRFGETLQTGTDVPLSEAVEDYEVEILEGTTVKRTISVSTPEAVYTANQQVTDFGVAQVGITVRVYQISEQVGRGTGTEATFP